MARWKEADHKGKHRLAQQAKLPCDTIQQLIKAVLRLSPDGSYAREACFQNTMNKLALVCYPDMPPNKQSELVVSFDKFETVMWSEPHLLHMLTVEVSADRNNCSCCCGAHLYAVGALLRGDRR